MKNLNRSIANHYLKEKLYEDIIARLKEQNIDLNNVKRSDIAGVDEFHVRGAEVSKELANSISLSGLSVLDVGCGLGGPCRMLADESEVFKGLFVNYHTENPLKAFFEQYFEVLMMKQYAEFEDGDSILLIAKKK